MESLGKKMISNYQINFNRKKKNMTFKNQIPTNTVTRILTLTYIDLE